jgi:hypothetical protein
MIRGILITIAFTLAVILALPQLVPPANNAGRPPMHHH